MPMLGGYLKRVGRGEKPRHWENLPNGENDDLGFFKGSAREESAPDVLDCFAEGGGCLYISKDEGSRENVYCVQMNSESGTVNDVFVAGNLLEIQKIQDLELKYGSEIEKRVDPDVMVLLDTDDEEEYVGTNEDALEDDFVLKANAGNESIEDVYTRFIDGGGDGETGQQFQPVDEEVRLDELCTEDLTKKWFTFAKKKKRDSTGVDKSIRESLRSDGHLREDNHRLVAGTKRKSLHDIAKRITNLNIGLGSAKSENKSENNWDTMRVEPAPNVNERVPLAMESSPEIDRQISTYRENSLSEESYEGVAIEDKALEWDVESYAASHTSNTENHPKTVDDRHFRVTSIPGYGLLKGMLNSGKKGEKDQSEKSGDLPVVKSKTLLPRDRNETPDERKKRKQLNNEYKRFNRENKKLSKLLFKKELVRQNLDLSRQPLIKY